MQRDPHNMPPFVKFEMVAVEDKTKELENGRYGYKNVEMANITRPGQRDTVVKEAKMWLDDLERHVRNERYPREWLMHFRKQYEDWKAGLETPVEGTPIRGWTVLYPAQQEELLSIGVRTVEQLAAANAEVQYRIGIGALDLKKKAENWLAVAEGPGKATSRLVELEKQNEALLDQIAQLRTRIEELGPKPAPAPKPAPYALP